MQFNSYLLFNGDCEEAFKTYEKIFGGKIEAMLTHEGTPASCQVPAEWQKKILHARITIGQRHEQPTVNAITSSFKVLSRASPRLP